VVEAVRWVSAEVARDAGQGRHIVTVESRGSIELGGISLAGTADRIDRLAGGGIAIVDYKTGKPPSAPQVKAGFALQLGLLGAIAEAGGFGDLGTEVEAEAFEYWSLAKGRDSFGYRYSPVKPGGTDKIVATEALVDHARTQFLIDAGKWLTGTEPFVAKLNPDLPLYEDYDQLMRLEEWYGRAGTGRGADG
jgi:ATP-dependent helicase/nuclease subunit B